MHLSILGSGYVGLVTGACLAEIGHDVVCTDNDEAKIETLLRGRLPIYEPGLSDLVERNVGSGRLRFTADMGDAVRFGDLIFICVGTPPLPNGDADLSAIADAAMLIAAEARSSKLVIEKSTVPMQTGRKLKRELENYARALHSPHSFHVASNPEFLREGTAIADFLHPERIVIGVEDASAEQQLREIYDPITSQSFACPVHVRECPRSRPALVVAGINTAELIKHACNSFLAVKISYANLIADICEKNDADVEQVVSAMGLDSRIGPAFLRPGLGFGGFCLPKDIQAFIKVGEDAGVDVSLLRAADQINKGRVDRILLRLQHELWILKHKRIGILGLSYKPNTDDVRFSPAIELSRRLVELGAEVQAYDPRAMEKARTPVPNIKYCESAYDAALGAQALVIATEWECFNTLDWSRVKDLMTRPLLIDGRNLLDAEAMAALCFEYYSVGRPHKPVAVPV